MEDNRLDRKVTEFAGRDYVKTAILGAALVVAGVVIILNNLGIITYTVRNIIISWQMLLIVIGIAGFFNRNRNFGAILILIGTFFLLPKIPMLHLGYRFIQNFWPALLVVCGLMILIYPGGFSSGRSHVHYREAGPDPDGMHHSETSSEDGYIYQRYFFSGADQTFVSPVFKGGDIQVTFGGTNLDLRKTNLPEDQDAYLKIRGTFGGMSIYVPSDWRVEVRSTSFLGGVTDSRPRGVEHNSARRLVIDVQCAFGGVEIR